MNKQFVELLQIALGTREQLSRALNDKEWEEVYKTAERQGLIGVVFGGIERLARDLLPNMDLLMDWLGQTEYQKTQNELVNGRCKEITEMLAKDGFRSCVLKGQANASYYPKPELRSSGDIDIWVVPEESEGLEQDRKKVAEYVIAREDDYIRMQYHHIDYHVFPDVEVEVHFCPMVLFNYRKNEVLQQKFRSEKDFCFVNRNEAGTFCTLTYMPNVLMQLVHMYRHVFDGGIGLKQLVDFYYLLMDIQKRQGSLAYAQLRKDVEEVGLTKFCGGVCYVIEQLFLNGTNAGLLLAEPNKKHGELLMRELQKWSDKADKTIATSGRKSKLANFTGSISQNSRLWRYYPSDCLWNIYYRLSQYQWRKKNGWK